MTVTTALLSNKRIDKAGEFANRVGGIVASKEGAMPDVRDEFAELIKEFN